MEYIIRNSDEDYLIMKSIGTNPIVLSDTSHRLKKTVLLRAIQSEVSRAVITENVLNHLEMVEEMDRCDGIQISNLMKAAYCSVALECTVKYLVGFGANENYLAAVERIWRGRVMKLGDSGFFSTELIWWKNELEGAIRDTNVLNNLMRMNTRTDALRLVGDYFSEEWKILDRSCLQQFITRIEQLYETESPLRHGPERDVREDTGLQLTNVEFRKKKVQGCDQNTFVSTNPHVRLNEKEKNVTKDVHRRKQKSWTEVEEDTLRYVVQRDDIGKWKHILESYRDVFVDRTAVDLKDKWRNLSTQR